MHELSGFTRDNCEEDYICESNLIENRRACLKTLTTLISNTKNPYVLSINSQWGNGKTFFIKSLKKKLEERGAYCAYFNAWETDHSGNPLVSLVGEISKQIHNETIPQSIKEITTTCGKIITRAPSILKALMASVLKKVAGEDFGKVLEDILNEVAGSIVNDFVEAQKARDAFIKQLTAIAETCRQESKSRIINNGEPTKGFPLVVLVDELDRCHPDYALKLLEDIKHLFLVENVFFILAIDPEQLKNLVQHRYGFNSERSTPEVYLQKFIDAFYILPEPNTISFVYEKLKSSNIPTPSRFQCFDGKRCSSVFLNNIDPLTANNDSYWYIISHLVVGQNKPLRELSQIIEKFSLISRCYNLEWIESFAIFMTMITHKESSKDFDIASIIFRNDYNNRYKTAGVTSQSMAHYLCTIFRKHISGEGLPDDNLSNQAEINEVLRFYVLRCYSYNDTELKESVLNKIKFLQRFNASNIIETK